MRRELPNHKMSCVTSPTTWVSWSARMFGTKCETTRRLIKVIHTFKPNPGECRAIFTVICRNISCNFFPKFRHYQKSECAPVPGERPPCPSCLTRGTTARPLASYPHQKARTAGTTPGSAPTPHRTMLMGPTPEDSPCLGLQQSTGAHGGGGGRGGTQRGACARPPMVVVRRLRQAWSSLEWIRACTGIVRGIPRGDGTRVTVDRRRWRVSYSAPWGRTVRCAHAVRKVGCFPPPVATGPRVLNSAPPMPL